MTLPFVTCVCPTYGRFPERGWLLGEAVESFLRQDYPADRRELVILNDCVKQRVAPPHPHTPDGERWRGVRIYQYCDRYETLGEKYNAAISLGVGDLIAPWEDDDVCLPHRLSLSVERLGDADYYNPLAYWFLCGDQLKHEQRTGYAHSASIFRRTAWEAVGGYPLDCRQDAGMDSRLRRAGLKVAEGPLQPSESFYIYRWGVSDHHVSAHGERADEAYRAYGERPVAVGSFDVAPAWRQDYEAIVRAKL